MADSFFGFDISTLPPDDLGALLEKELSEDEYDALNDETFNQAVKDDWEDGHETLVRIEHKQSDHTGKLDDSEDGEYDSDLDINFITKLDEFDISNDESDVSRSHFQLDPSVWANPKPLTPSKTANVAQKQNQQEIFTNSKKITTVPPPPGLISTLTQQTNALQQFIGSVPQPINAHPKILSVEEIERNIISQQQQKLIQEKQVGVPAKYKQNIIPAINQQASIPQNPSQPHSIRKQHHGMNFSHAPHINAPPSYPLFPPHLQGPSKINAMVNIGNRPINNNFHHFATQMTSLPPPPPRSQQIPLQMSCFPPPHLVNMQGNSLVYQNQNFMSQNSAQFNQRLVHEIQQNHPMLNPMQFRNQNNFHPLNFNNNHNNNSTHQRFINNSGKMEEHDEYANLMSNRDKQFLITIQLMQLNTETPYFDDYYYTMYKERQRSCGIENESQAHRDNQLNHPFTQPKGHAQMLLRQFNNISKNGLQNQKNGLGRERHNSESSNKNDGKDNPTPRTYTPLQFENSLGKLQCGSVTAPRKIIDMEVVSNAENGQNSISDTAIQQKKSRQVLLYIEMLYKIVLKLEDLHHPLAIAASIILKEKREKQRIQNEYEKQLDLDNIGSAKCSISMNEPESKNDLLIKLFSLLSIDKIPSVMAVRKGRAILKRIFPHIKDQEFRWDLWNTIFISITLFKRDKLEEIEESLMMLYYEFATQLQDADFGVLLKITNNLMTSDKLMGYVNGCKFVVSSIIAIIIKCELMYQKEGDKINFAEEEQWILFLNKLFEIVNSDQSVDAKILLPANKVHCDHDRIIRTVIANFQRFKPRFVCDDEKLVRLLSIQYDLK